MLKKISIFFKQLFRKKAEPPKVVEEIPPEVLDDIMKDFRKELRKRMKSI